MHRLFLPPPHFVVLPLNFILKFKGRASDAFGNVAVPLFFAEKEGDENWQCQFGGGKAIKSGMSKDNNMKNR